MNTIVFQNKKYPIRKIKLMKLGEILISTISLNKLLLKGGNYVSNEAMFVDEQIYYFVNSRQIKLGQERLTKLVNSEVHD